MKLWGPRGDNKTRAKEAEERAIRTIQVGKGRIKNQDTIRAGWVGQIIGKYNDVCMKFQDEIQYFEC